MAIFIFDTSLSARKAAFLLKGKYLDRLVVYYPQHENTRRVIHSYLKNSKLENLLIYYENVILLDFAKLCCVLYVPCILLVSFYFPGFSDSFFLDKFFFINFDEFRCLGNHGNNRENTMESC